MPGVRRFPACAPAEHLGVQVLPPVVEHIQREEHFHPVLAIRENVQDGPGLGAGHGKGIQHRVGKGGFHFGILGVGKEGVHHRDFGLVMVKGIPRHPVAGGHGASVNAQIVGGNAVFLPQLHGQHPVDDVAGSENQNIVFPVVLQKGPVFVIAVIYPQGPGEKGQSPCQKGKQRKDADRLPKLLGESLNHSPAAGLRIFSSIRAVRKAGKTYSIPPLFEPSAGKKSLAASFC